jgi:hypothetical protein
MYSKKAKFSVQEGAADPEDDGMEEVPLDPADLLAAQTRTRVRPKRPTGNIIDPASLTVKDIRTLTKSFNDKAWQFPSARKVTYMALQLLYYMQIVMQVGDVRALVLPDPLHYAYGKKDEMLPLGPKNICKLND